MHAQQIMTREPMTVSATETMGMALERLCRHGLHMMPVLREDGAVLGVVTMFSIMAHIVPNYIVTGDLKSVPYAPDLGLLRRQFTSLTEKPVTDVMDAQPLLVKPEQSLLSVAAALISFDRHEYALVADEHNKLLGVISAGDILGYLKQAPDEASGA